MTHARKSRFWRTCFVCLIIVFLSACSTSKRGGYYKDDGPEANPPSNLDQVPDAVPKIEPLASGPNKPYTVLGRSYTPDTSGKPYRIQGRASWYGKKFHGSATSNGERYDMYAMTAAHPTLPIPSYVRVTRLENNKTVILRVNDRGPFHSDRIIDLSYVAAYKLGMLGPGSTDVIVERIMPDQIRNWQPDQSSSKVAISTPLAVEAPLIDAPLATSLASPHAPADAVLQPPVVRSKPASPSLSGTQAAERATPLAANSMFLQLGAFSDQAKAQAMAARITGQLPPDVNAPVLIDRSATNLYRVRIGPFASRDAASQAVTSVSSATGVTPSLSPP